MIKVFEGSSFESIKIKKLLDSKGIKVNVSYVCNESIQPWTISSGGNYTTILEVNFIDQMKAEILIKNYYQRVITLLEKSLIEDEQL
jgi:hypothetical protein